MTIRSDLTVGSEERANVTHFDHWPSEGDKEGPLVGGECVDQANGGGAGRREQHLVGDEQSVGRLKVLVVFVIEHIGGGDVEVGEDSGRGRGGGGPAERA